MKRTDLIDNRGKLLKMKDCLLVTFMLLPGVRIKENR